MINKILKDLINSISPSGYEGPAAQIWKKEAQKFADKVWTDSHGSSHAVINSKEKLSVMLAGHCDEIGFQVSYIDEQGFIWIQPLGGWDAQIAQGQRVQILTKNGIVKGVIGKLAIHLQTPEQRKKVSEIKDLWIDIGSKDKKQSEALIDIGDPLVIDYGFDNLKNDIVVGRAFDNRSGAFVVLEAARELSKIKTNLKVHTVATSQEEIGLRGAKTSSYGVNPDVAIAVDVTFATDHPQMGDVIKRENNIKLGGGPVLTRGPNMNPKLYDLLVKTAKENKISVQINAEPRGTGTDANAIQLCRSGVPTCLVSIPLRYMHSPCELVHLKDIENCIKLISQTVNKISKNTNFTPF